MGYHIDSNLLYASVCNFPSDKLKPKLLWPRSEKRKVKAREALVEEVDADFEEEGAEYREQGGEK